MQAAHGKLEQPEVFDIAKGIALAFFTRLNNCVRSRPYGSFSVVKFIVSCTEWIGHVLFLERLLRAI